MVNLIKVDILKQQLPFWDNLSEFEQGQLQANSNVVRYKAGDNVCGFEAEAGVLLILSGSLRSYLMSEDGKTVNVYRLKPGEACVLSASGIIDAIDFTLYIDACEDSEVMVIPISVFSKIVEQNIYAENFVHKRATARLSDVISAVEKMMFASLEDRILDFIYNEVSEKACHKIFITHEELARSIGSAREAVSRALKRLEEGGRIALFRGGFVVTDPLLIKYKK